MYLDDQVYFDLDGDRSSLSPWSYVYFDAIIALAETFQLSSVMSNNLTEPEYLAIREYEILKELVSFEGISGPVSFNEIGDRYHTRIDVFICKY